MNYKSKKALSLVTTFVMSVSLANPLLAVAAEQIPLTSGLVTATEVENSKCNLASLSVTGCTLSPEFNAGVLNYTIEDLAYNKASITVKATAETEGSTVAITYINAAGQEKTASSSGTVSSLRYGKNTVNVNVTSEDGTETKTYTISFVKNSALKSIDMSIDGVASVLTPVFSSSKYEYETTTIKSAKKALIKAVELATGVDNVIKVNDEVLGEEGVEVALNGSQTVIPIAISGNEGLGKTVYNITVNQVEEALLKVNTNVEGATIRLVDPDGNEVAGNGTYSGLLSGKTYKAIATKYGYVAATKEITLVDGEQVATLELAKAPASVLELVTSEWKNFRGNDENMGFTEALTPRNSSEAAVKWNVKLGSGWSAAPSVQIEVDDSIVVLSAKKIYKLSKADGSIMAEGDMVAATNFGYTPPTYENGMIFAPLAGGVIQAFNAKTLESLWVSEGMGGQSLSPIAYDNGYIYAGFWNSETKDGDFVCISTTDEDLTKTNETKTPSWVFTVPGGFYWAGAYAEGDTIVVGTDDGQSGYQGTGHVYSLDKNTGKVIDKIDVIGDQRSTIAYDKESGKLFFTTKAGYLYSVKMNADGTFNKESLIKSEQSGQSTSTPLVYKGRVYYGSGVLNASGGKLIVADAKTLEKIYEVPLKAYPQASILLSTAYEEAEGKVYIYSTYNANPGGITVIKDAPGQTEPIYEELIELPKELQQYCICSPICDSEGTIYYKNDSANVIAIKNTNNSVKVTFDAGDEAEAVVKTVVKNKALDYLPEAPVKEGYTFVGWYKDVDDVTTAYENNSKYTEDVVYKAKYVHATMLGAQGKEVVNDKSGIRFGTKVYNDGDKIKRQGTIIIPAALADGSLTLDTPKAAVSEGKSIYEKNDAENYFIYLGTLVNIPKAKFDTKITASAYIEYEDKAGNTYMVYIPYVGADGSTSIAVNDLIQK